MSAPDHRRCSSDLQMSGAESPALSTTLYAYLSAQGISVPEEVEEHWRPEAFGKLSVGKVLDLAALRKESDVSWRVFQFVRWRRCLYSDEWPEKATALMTRAFSKVVGRLAEDAKRCRKNSDPAASQALLGSIFACQGEQSQIKKEASGQTDERPPALQNTLTIIVL